MNNNDQIATLTGYIFHSQPLLNCRSLSVSLLQKTVNTFSALILQVMLICSLLETYKMFAVIHVIHCVKKAAPQHSVSQYSY